MRKRRLLAWLVSLTMLMSSMSVMATEATARDYVDPEEETVVESSLITDDGDDEINEISNPDEEDKESVEESLELVESKEDSETIETSEETTCVEETIQTETETELVENKFGELDEHFTLTDEEREAKKNLELTLTSLDGAVEDVDYVSNQIVFLADTREEAEAVARAYYGELVEYEYGVGTVLLTDEVTVAEAVEYSAREDVNMLPVSPNYISYLCDEYNEIENETITSENGEEIDSTKALIISESISEDIEEVELEGVIDADYSDPYLHNSASKYQYMHTMVGTQYAWKAGYKGKGVKVAVIDSGITPDASELPVSSRKNIISSASLDDKVGHGTHVAGIISARLNGKYGAGIAPESTMYGIKITDSFAVEMDEQIKAINAAVTEYGVDIINLSMGSVYYSSTYQQAVTKAYNQGVAIFAAAGNSGGNNYAYPACYDHVVSVASVNEEGVRSEFSNCTNKVDISAPGSRIWSNNYTGGDYESKSGTSQACPVAVGEAAVILSSGILANKNKGPARVDELVGTMKKNAKPVGKDMGAGICYLPYVFGLTTEARKPANPSIQYTISNDYKTITATISAQKYSQIIYTTDGKVPNIAKGIGTRVASNQAVNKFEVTKNAHVIKAIAVNDSGLVSAVVTSNVKVSPKVANIEISGVSQIAQGKSSTLAATVLPTIATNKKLAWSIVGNPKGITVSAAGKVTVAKDASIGNYTVYAQATDGSNIKKAFAIKVIDAKAAERVKNIKFSEKTVIIDRYKASATKDLFPYISLLDSSGVSITASRNDVVWSSNKPNIASVNGGVVTALSPGNATITVMANDGSGKKATINVRVQQKVTEISFTGDSNKLAVGKRMTIKATVNTDATNKKLSFVISPADKGVTVSSSGVVTATTKAVPGLYTVTATAVDGSGTTLSRSFNVITGSITKLTADKKNATIFRVADTKNKGVNEPTSCVIRIAPEGGAGFDPSMLMAQSSNEQIVKVGQPYKDGSNFVVVASATGYQPGSATVTISTTDGSNKNVKVNIKVINPASSLTISAKKGDGTSAVIEGKSVKLVANLGDLYGTPGVKKIKWEVKAPAGKEKYVSVSGGNLSVKPGMGTGETVVVTATLDDGSGLSASYSMFTISKYNAISKLLISTSPYTTWFNNFEIPKTKRMRANPNDIQFVGYIKAVTGGSNWIGDISCSSSNNDSVICMISGDEVHIVAIKPGKSTITIKDNITGVSAKYTIQVY